MKHKRGFSLISFLLYVLLNVIIIGCVYTSITQIIVPSVRDINSGKQQLALHVIADLFVREIRSHVSRTWKITAPTCIIWNDGEKDICWRMHKNRLERIEGIYTHDTWQKKTTSILKVGIERVTFEYDYSNGKVVGIKSIFAHNKNSQKIVQQYVAVRLSECL